MPKSRSLAELVRQNRSNQPAGVVGAGGAFSQSQSTPSLVQVNPPDTSGSSGISGASESLAGKSEAIGGKIKKIAGLFGG